MSNDFCIGSRLVGANESPLVIAEIGINHGGSLDLAIEMVNAAADCGAEIVKHQTHVVADEMSNDARQVIPGNADVSIYEIMERCSLSPDKELKMKRHAESRGLIWISTPFSLAAADLLESWDVPAYKIGSGECNNYPLVRHIAGFGKPIILSTGMNNVANVAKSVEIMREAGVPFALMHCTNLYPTPPELVRLGGVTELMEAFPDAQVGLSDHTVGNLACLGAVALGATILERHFTDRMDRKGPDIVCSMDPTAMAELIEGSAFLAKARGGSKGLVAEEQVTADFAFASVVTIAPVRVGEAFTRENLWVKRPGTGDYSADDYESLLGGHVASCDIERGVQLKAEDVEQE